MNRKIGILAALAVTISIAQAQVASHKPTPTKSSSAFAIESSIMKVTDKPVVRINGVVLTDRDLLREMLAIFPYARTHNGFPKAEEQAIRGGAMQMIEFEELVYQAAQRRGMAIPAARLKKAVEAYRATFATEQDFQKYLDVEMHGSTEQMRKQIQRSLLIEAFLKSQLDEPSRVTVAQAKAFYLKNPKPFMHSEQIQFQSISIMPPDNAEADVKEKAHKRANEILVQAKATHNYEEFGLLAEKVSEDDYRVNMGDHKVTKRTDLPPEVQKILDALKPGQVSNLCQFGSYYTMFRLESRIPAGKVPFAEVQEKLQGDLTKARYNKLRGQLDKSLRAQAKVVEL